MPLPDRVVRTRPAPSERTTRLLVLAGIAGVAGWVASAAVMGTIGRGWSLDLRVYLAAGRAFLEGRDAYSAHFTSGHLPFSYPPSALAALSPLSLLPVWLVEVLWWGADALALTTTVAIALRDQSLGHRARWWCAIAIGGIGAIVLEPVRSGVDYGQVNVVLMLAVVADLLAVRGTSRGLLTGLAAAIKLTPLYFIVVFLAARDVRGARNALGAFAAITGTAALCWPHDTAHYFLHELRDPNRFGGLGSVSNQAWAGILHRTPFLGLPAATALWWVLCVATTIVVLAIAGLVVRRSRLLAVTAVGLGALLVSPLSWSHHWCWLVLLPVTAYELRGHRVLVAQQALLIVLGVAAPYTVFRHGASRSIASSLLVLATAAFLGTWLAIEVRSSRRAGRTADPILASEDPGSLLAAPTG